MKSIGADFNADIHSCVADSVNLYCMVAEKTEKRQGRKRQGDYAAAQGAADRVSRPLHEGRAYSVICFGKFY